MEIHNVMEDFVLEIVSGIFSEEERSKVSGFCTCGRCKLDVSCYVLNRIEPEYVVSSRGASRAGTDNPSFIQKKTDIVVLANEAISRINSQRRPGDAHSDLAEPPAEPEGPVFNMPCVMGRVFDGSTFAPLVGARVELLIEGVRATMIDASWQNPAELVSQNGGTYVFYPFPVKAELPGARSTFRCELRCQMEGFEAVSHYFELELISETRVIDLFSMQRVHKIQDLYLFPPGESDD